MKWAIYERNINIKKKTDNIFFLRIVNGVESAVNSLPWMISMQDKDGQFYFLSNSFFFGGGGGGWWCRRGESIIKHLPSLRIHLH